MKYNKNEILNWISENYAFPYDFNAEDAYSGLICALEKTESPIGEFDCDNGISKIVIIPKEQDFVIKIPFICSTEEYYNSYYGTGRVEHFEFDGGGHYFEHNTGECWDYCLTELSLYEKAVELNIDVFLPETKLLGYVDDHPIYVQEKCTPMRVYNKKKYYTEKYSSVARSFAKEYKKKHSNEYQFYNPLSFNVEWCLSLNNYCNNDKLFNNIISFIDKHIRDIEHDDNLGYAKDGRPVIIDFSSFTG